MKGIDVYSSGSIVELADLDDNEKYPSLSFKICGDCVSIELLPGDSDQLEMTTTLDHLFEVVRTLAKFFTDETIRQWRKE